MKNKNASCWQANGHIIKKSYFTAIISYECEKVN